MCESQYRPDVSIPEQIEQLLHNISTWRDATVVIGAQLPDEHRAQLRLAGVGGVLTYAHRQVEGALRLCLATQRAQAVTSDG